MEKKKTAITAEMAIWRVAMIKGKKGGEIVDRLLCDGEEKLCCPGASLFLSYAAKLKGKEEILPRLLGELNSLEDACCKVHTGCIFCCPPVSYTPLASRI